MIQFLLLAALQVASPRTDAAVVGTVRDAESGRPLIGATVTAVDAGRSARSNGEGRYAIAALPSGPQHIALRSLGHAPYALHVMVPRQGTVELNVSLQALPTRLPIVTIRRYRGTIDRGEGGASPSDERTIAAAELARHPQLAEPDFLRAMAGGDLGVAPETPGGLHVRGGSADQTGYAIDGVPVFNPYHVSDLMGAWNTDALSGARLSMSADGASMLSGALLLTSRTPGAHLTSRGAISTTHVRLAADGPLVGNVGFLVSGRLAFPAGLAPKRDPTVIRGESQDVLAKLETSAGRGILRALFTRSADEMNVSPVRPEDVAGASIRRNELGWASSAAAMQWLGRIGSDSLTISGWRSATEASGSWTTTTLASRRTDLGLQAVISSAVAASPWRAGLRIERPEMTYQVQEEDTTRLAMRTMAPLVSVFTALTRAVAQPLRIGASASTVLFRGRLYLAPDVTARWTLSDHLAISGTLSRSHQFSQSLRNPESTVGYVFPADLYMGAERGAVPVATSDEASLVADFELVAGIRTRLHGYSRNIRGIVLVAPIEESPFLRGTPAAGTATVRGAYAAAEASGKRYVALARYGVQRSLYQHDGSRYTPAFAARQSLDAGVTTFPTPTTSVRLAVTAALGRRATPASGALEWESCNLRDRACEFAGNPRADTSLTGAYRLPSYARLDLGVRKHGHLRLGSRSAEVAVFGTYSNVLGRFNVLTYALAAGGPDPIEMRPQSPFVLGVDWRF